MKYALISQRQMIEIESAFETKRLFATVKDIETIDKALKILHLLKFIDAVEITGAELAKPEQSNYSDIVSNGGLDPRNKFDAQPEQEPVAWMYKGNFHDFDPSEWASPEFVVTPLYTAPPRKEWVGLTDHDIELTFLISGFTAKNFAHAIEANLKERNT